MISFRKTITLVVIAIILLNIIPASTVIPAEAGIHDIKILGVDPQLIEMAIEGKELVFNRRYNEALTFFDEISKKYPDSPTGAAGKMSVWQTMMFENEDNRFLRQYEAAEKQYVKVSRHLLRRGDVPSWDLFVCGAADGMRGFLRSQQGHWFSALSNGLHAIRLLKQLKWKEPDFIDVDVGLGAYVYWRSYMAKLIKILPFFKDRRIEGISMIENVAKNGKYARDIAEANLVFIYQYEKRYKEAARMADKLLKRYPQNLIIAFMKGKIELSQKKYNEAIGWFDRIYKTDSAITKTLYYKGIALYKQKNYAEAKNILQGYISKETAKDWLGWAHYRLGVVEEAMGNKEAAITNYKKALDFDGSVKPAKKRLVGVRHQ